MTEEARTAHLLLTVNQNRVDVAFEPEGEVVTLSDDDSLTVEISGPGSGVVEVMYGPEGLTVCAWDRAKTRVWNKKGDQIRV